jgi:hypothetical protein
MSKILKSEYLFKIEVVKYQVFPRWQVLTIPASIQGG